jgi:hypothetical protein
LAVQALALVPAKAVLALALASALRLAVLVLASVPAKAVLALVPA